MARIFFASLLALFMFVACPLKYWNCFYSEWLDDKKKLPAGVLAFEDLPDSELDVLLKEFFCAVLKKNGEPYSKSGMVNIRSSINRHLRLPPHNRCDFCACLLVFFMLASVLVFSFKI